jgi:hypothetical protein
LLTRLGRGDEALEAAWADFREHPSKYGYDELMKFVPKATRQEWHDEKALDAAKGEDLHSLLKLFVETKAMERLAELVRGASYDALEGVRHHATEPAAEASIQALPPGSGAPRACASSMPKKEQILRRRAREFCAGQRLLSAGRPRCR